MKRENVVTVALQGDLGKPRPAIIVQTDAMMPSQLRSVLVCPVTSFTSKPSLFRVPIEPTEENGLFSASEIMVDKNTPANRERIREVIGVIDNVTMAKLERAMSLVLGFAG